MALTFNYSRPNAQNQNLVKDFFDSLLAGATDTTPRWQQQETYDKNQAQLDKILAERDAGAYNNTNNTPTATPTAYSGGGGSSSNKATASQLAEYDQAINQLNRGIDRLGGQESIALANLQDQFNVKNNELATSLNRGQTNYNSQTQENVSSRRNNINAIDDQSSESLRGLLMKLSSIGANGTARDLAGRMVQGQATRERAGAGTAYANNQRSLDTNWGNFQKDIDDEKTKVTDWLTKSRQDAQSQIANTRQSLLTQLAQLRSQQATAKGANGANAARADLNAANALDSQIDSLARFSPTYTGNRVDYTPGTLDSYSVGGNTAVNTTQSGLPGTDSTTHMYRLTEDDDDELKKRELGY